MRKPFDRQLFEENDKIAKDAVRRYLETRGVRVEEGDRYDIDLYAFKGWDLVAAIEVERRPGWTDKFPFSTVHVPHRKAKFLEITKVPSYLFSVRADCKAALWCKGKVIMESPVVEMSNRYLSNEKFFDVPIEQWNYVNL